MFALGLFVFGGGVPSTNASVSIESVDDFGSGTEVTVTVNGEIGFGQLTVTVTGDTTTDMDLAVDDCNPNCTAEDDGAEADADNGEVSVTVDTEDVSGSDGAALEIILLLTATCEEQDELTIEVEQPDGDAPLTASTEVNCLVGNAVIILESPDDTDLEYDFSVSASGSQDCEGDFPLVDGESEQLICEADVEYTVTQETIPDNATLTIDCEDTGSPTIEIDEEAGTVVFELTDDETIECVFLNELGPDGPGVPETVTVSAPERGQHLQRHLLRLDRR
jgi:hypothetical protein